VWQHTFSCRVAVITYDHIIWTYNYEDDKKQQHEATDILVRHYKQLTPDIQGTWFNGENNTTMVWASYCIFSLNQTDEKCKWHLQYSSVSLLGVERQIITT